MAKYELKTRKQAASPDDFIAAIEDPVRRADCTAMLAMMRRITGCEPAMWGSSIVGFDQYRYRYASGQEGDWPITGFSPRKQALTLYIMPGFARYRQLLDRLGKHTTGKSCLYVKRLADVDQQVLAELIAESVQAMRKQYPR